MHIDILSVVPELLESPFQHSIIKRAQAKNIVNIVVHNLRKWAINQHGQIDDYQYGGGAGMVIRCEPLVNAIEELTKMHGEYDDIIYLTPDGLPLSQPIANQLSLSKKLLLICGHYKGIDERVRTQWVTKEISIGDYVLSGGELPAAVLVDSIVRLLPKVLQDETSALTDSFQDNLLAPPIYTRPANFRGYTVPDILLNGNEKDIAEWRLTNSEKRTNDRRPHLNDNS
ncbi:MAG: tRNA (guanosine(37)-N1)-methyltransferase TrmD [Phycisphaerales bacterium]|nr:tRNA (guanosine(37)-N1)-methyltransferase TrmD [Phycisphaerales bacterium]